MAVAEKSLAAQFNTKELSPIDHYTYAFVGDGCLMEGVSHEACSFAGTHKLGKLICFYDQNGISIDGEIDNWFTDNTVQRFDSYGWQTIEVDGHNIEEISQAIESSKQESEKPSMIFCKTTIGFGSPNKSGTSGVHGSPLGDEEIVKTREALNWEHAPFEVPQSVYDFWDAREVGKTNNEEWDSLMEIYKKDYPDKHAELSRRMDNRLTASFDENYAHFLNEAVTNNISMATRKASQVCLDFFVGELPELMGGSADLTPSNNTFSKASSVFFNDTPEGNHINYGVREFGMSAMMNGMVLHGGIKPYGATFLVFTDYARNALRLSLLWGFRIYLYIHMIQLHLVKMAQPTNQLSILLPLRATPNLNNWRPADLIETAVGWKEAITSTKTPHSLVLSRQNLPHIQRTKDQVGQIENGGYLLSYEDNADITLIASGSEVKLIAAAAQSIKEEGFKVNVVSMPCLDKFYQQDEVYRDSVVDPMIPKLIVEALHPDSWHGLVNLADTVIGMNTFGESAPASELMAKFGFTENNIITQAKKLLSK
jgi:transketolase